MPRPPPATETTRTTQHEQPSPRLPHEHDQSSDSQQSATPEGDAVGQQAHDDLQRGLKDTDRGPVLDKVYNEKVRQPG